MGLRDRRLPTGWWAQEAADTRPRCSLPPPIHPGQCFVNLIHLKRLVRRLMMNKRLYLHKRGEQQAGPHHYLPFKLATVEK